MGYITVHYFCDNATKRKFLSAPLIHHLEEMSKTSIILNATRVVANSMPGRALLVETGLGSRFLVHVRCLNLFVAIVVEYLIDNHVEDWQV